MSIQAPERRLATILCADVVAYSRLIACDEEGTIRRLRAYREIVDGFVAAHRGRIFGSAGDSVVAEFSSPVEAVRCAVEIQGQLQKQNAAIAADVRMQFRIGINLGDVVVEGDDLLGDGVNVAARLESLADPGGICTSANVQEHVSNKIGLPFDDMGLQRVKNLPRPVRAYRLRWNGDVASAVHPRAWGRARTAFVVAASAVVLVVASIWATWPRPLGLVFDLVGISAPPANPPLPNKPSVAVLPFSNLSGDPEQEYFSDGITEDLITQLSRSARLFVIARNSTFTYKGKPANIEQVGRELGVRYVVEGSVRKDADRVRVTAQLIDARNGFHVWSERYDRDLVDIFALQDDLSEHIMASVGLEIEDAEVARIRRKPTTNLTAYDAVLLGRSGLGKFTRQGFEDARVYLQRAIELDPAYAEAIATLSALYFLEYRTGWNLDPGLVERAKELAGRALEIDPEEPVALHIMGAAIGTLGKEDEGRIFCERSIAADPNWNIPRMVLGFHQVRAGEVVDAVRSLNHAMRLNPQPPPGDQEWMGFLHFRVGRIDEAVELWRSVRAANPDLLVNRVGLTVIYEGRGQHAEAQEIAAEIMAINPDLSADAAVERLIPEGLLDDTLKAEWKNRLRRAGLH